SSDLCLSDRENHFCARMESCTCVNHIVNGVRNLSSLHHSVEIERECVCVSVCVCVLCYFLCRCSDLGAGLVSYVFHFRLAVGRVCVCVCVCVLERESVCVFERGGEREREYVC